MTHKTEVEKMVHKITLHQEIMRDKPKCETCLAFRRHDKVTLLWFKDTVRVWKCKRCHSLWKKDAHNDQAKS